jgi:hypothetical protein
VRERCPRVLRLLMFLWLFASQASAVDFTFTVTTFAEGEAFTQRVLYAPFDQLNCRWDNVRNPFSNTAVVTGTFTSRGGTITITTMPFTVPLTGGSDPACPATYSIPAVSKSFSVPSTLPINAQFFPQPPTVLNGWFIASSCRMHSANGFVDDPACSAGDLMTGVVFAETELTYVQDANTGITENGYDVRVPFQTTVTDSGCQTNVSRLSQGDPDWASIQYDHSPNVTIQQKGCALTSLSMALNSAGVSNTPFTLNDFMSLTDGDFIGASVNWGAATRDVSGPLNLKFHFQAIDSTDDMQAATDYLANVVCEQRHPVIVGVDLDSNGTPGHFVVVTGKQGNDYTIADPGFSSRTLLSDYNDEFVTRGFVADPAGDISELDVAVGDVAEFLITDPSGRKTGYDSATSKIVKEIPNSEYFRDALQNDVTGAAPTETNHFASIFQPNSTTYNVVVTGLKLGTFTLVGRIFAQDGTPAVEILVSGIAGPGSSTEFTIHENTTPPAQANVGAKATFDGTLDDINNALLLQLIDNRGIAKSLSQKILAARADSALPRSQSLGAFINEVNAQAGKHLTALAADVLIRDANSLLKQ